MLNSQQLKEHITGPIPDENMQQIGIDLNLIKVEEIAPTSEWPELVYSPGGVRSNLDTLPVIKQGRIPTHGKTQLAGRRDVHPVVTPVDGAYWDLQPGTYDVTFEQGCKVPSNAAFFIVHRSSLLRNGSTIQTGVFDPGFETEHMGAVMVVTKPIKIGVSARVAQVFAHECTPVQPEQLYSGQFQGDQQRSLAIPTATEFTRSVESYLATLNITCMLMPELFDVQFGLAGIASAKINVNSALIMQDQMSRPVEIGLVTGPVDGNPLRRGLYAVNLQDIITKGTVVPSPMGMLIPFFGKDVRNLLLFSYNSHSEEPLTNITTPQWQENILRLLQ